MIEIKKKIPGQIFAVELDWVFIGQSQLTPFGFLLPKHELHVAVRQVTQCIFNTEQAFNKFIKVNVILFLKKYNNNIPGQISVEESDWVFGGQSQLIPFVFRLPKQELQDAIRQVIQCIFNTVHACKCFFFFF